MNEIVVVAVIADGNPPVNSKLVPLARHEAELLIVTAVQFIVPRIKAEGIVTKIIVPAGILLPGI